MRFIIKPKPSTKYWSANKHIGFLINWRFKIKKFYNLLNKNRFLSKRSILFWLYPQYQWVGAICCSKNPYPFIKNYIKELDKALTICRPGQQLSRTQKAWLSFCAMVIIITNSVCWACFEKSGIGRYGITVLSWMFCKSKISWDFLLQISVAVILRRYGISEGNIGIDDTNKKRSISTKKIHNVPNKIKDKPSGGYVMGHSLVFLVLITQEITIPIDFSFHMPDPVLRASYQNDNKLKKKGVSAKQRPDKPQRNPDFPTIAQITLGLLENYKKVHPDIRIRCMFADALYGTELSLLCFESRAQIVYA